MKRIIDLIATNFSQKIGELIPEPLLAKVHYFFPSPTNNIRRLSIDFRIWLTSVINLFVRLIIRLFTVIIAWSFILNFIKYLWFIYVNTEAGRVFLSGNPSKTILFTIKTLELPIFPLAVDICLNILVIGAVFCAMLSFFMIRRYLYDERGPITKLVFSFGLSYLTIYLMESYNSYDQMKSLVFLYYVPTLFLMDVIFEFISNFVPEITIISKTKYKIRELRETARIRNSE